MERRSGRSYELMIGFFVEKEARKGMQGVRNVGEVWKD
jgi:hypothetical protein